MTREKLRDISALGVSAGPRVFRAERTHEDLVLRSTPAPVDLDELRERVARRKRAEASIVSSSQERVAAPAHRIKATPRTTNKPEAAPRAANKSEAKPRGPRTNPAAAATLSRMRQIPQFEAKRKAAQRGAMAKRKGTKSPASSERMKRLHADPKFEAKRISALKASWTPERRAAASVAMAAKRRDPVFCAKQAAAAAKSRTPEFEAKRLAALLESIKRRSP